MERRKKKAQTQLKRKNSSHAINYLIFLVIVVLVVIGVIVFCIFYKYKKQRDNYEIVREMAVEESVSGEKIINFEMLSEYSKDAVCSWITIPNTVVDYPLVHAEDNEYYLSHDAYGNESSSGAIFLNSYNHVTMDDPKTIIFGHSMKDGSMFHVLHNYEEESFGKEHSALHIYMMDGSTKKYHLLCVITTKEEDPAIYTMFDMMDQYDTADCLLEMADIKYSDPTNGNILVLSTCIRDNYRRVVVFQEEIGI